MPRNQTILHSAACRNIRRIVLIKTVEQFPENVDGYVGAGFEGGGPKVILYIENQKNTEIA